MGARERMGDWERRGMPSGVLLGGCEWEEDVWGCTRERGVREYCVRE